MRRSDFDYIVIAAMLVSGLYVTVTGLMADLFGIHQVDFHNYAGYLCVGLALLHVALNAQRIGVYLRQLRARLRLPRGDEEQPIRDRDGEVAIGRRQIVVAALSAAAGFLTGRLLCGRGRELPGDAQDIGALYHQWSTPGHALDLSLPDWGQRPSRYKTHPDVPRIDLPDPEGFHGLTVDEALSTRRSVRDYDGLPIGLDDLSRLLYAAQGITDERREFRAAPSAGALYPIELYPVVHTVADLASGIYHYAPRTHELEALREGNFRGEVTEAGLHQGFLGQSAVTFLLTAVFQRTRWKYRERAYRYILLEAGHIAQNLYLSATSMNLGACAVGAFYDDRYNALLGVDGGSEATVYLVSVGAPA